MSLPGIGPLPLYGFQRPGMLLFALVPLALLGLYVVMQARRRQRLRRYTEATVPQSVWRHVPIAASLLCLLLLTIALATPTHDMRIPRNRAVIMLVIDMSQSMRATDVEPNRLKAAEQAASQFASQLTPGINLGLVGFAGTPYLLVPPTPQHQATVEALKKLEFADSTATGQAIFTALHAIGASAVQGGDKPPPARIVLLSDGGENKPQDPSDPHDGAYTAARLAKDQGVPISTITFGTKTGHIELDGQRVNVPVSTDQMKKIAQLSGGQSYTATNLEQLNKDYNAIENEIGFRTVPGPGSSGWLRLGVITALIATALALLINRRLPA
ncbi:VWA domain-containing protein [Mycobacterium sp. 663a-19]|uniref:VWA domain-containing protein n=1 Tax=Mycobacterium sp. 663a-19 TaxID=2986148 RepID=UPI002D1F2675|nr:VWA domain-containing protein [Mycobacterium sp. 663a-19]MEB3982307.1 VWA domain-containing protein [Mycobacterium sp. 663a-19]